MILFPAIDLFEGKAVRLFKGDYARMTVYSEHPEEIGKDFAACGALSEHADTIVNYALDTKHTDMALLARETDKGQIKFSLRARAPYTVDNIASLFGGGGHPQASGITMDGRLDEAAGKVLDAMIQKLNG